jgi:protein-L-isoaspartate(D-aspartate) O-methyltransferase
MTPRDGEPLPEAPERPADVEAAHARLAAVLREAAAAPEPVLDAFAAVPRHVFLPRIPIDEAYADDAIVTHDEGGVPTSSSSQPSLMARMIAQLDVGAGARVLEIGAGTGYNAALLARLGAAVTTVELQPVVADAARAHLQSAGLAVADDVPAAGEVRVVTGDGASPPAGPYDRIIITAACWALPEPVLDVLADGGILVAPLRVNGVEVVMALHRDGAALRGSGGVPCGFMPLRGGAERPWRWALGGGGVATADADLGVEGRGALDRLLAVPGRSVGDPLGLGKADHALDALLWLGLQGDPLLSLSIPRNDGGRMPWTVGLDVLPASLLVIELDRRYGRVGAARLHGGQGALRACSEAMAAWRAAGTPGPDALELAVEPDGARAGWSLPISAPSGAATLVRGAHRWTLRFAER